MTAQPYIALAGIVLDSTDARELANFYRQLLGWNIVENEPGWVKLSPAEGDPRLSFQSESEYVPLTWPSDRSHQQMQLNFNVTVDDP